ncbi:MAG: hypothetical protein JWQ74_923 [Marmoricola sp.]|nr:hypothetical protein [Marmoricola sp.]
MSEPDSDLSPSAYFRATTVGTREVLEPGESAASGWSATMMRGPAVSGALARAVEQVQLASGRDDLRPARWTVDLLAPSPRVPSEATTHVLQVSRRLMLISAELAHEGRTTARGTALFLKATENPDNPVWSSGTHWEPPPASLRPTGRDPSLYFSEDSGWSADQTRSQDGSRRRAWHLPIPLVEGEEITAFQVVASLADLTSLTANWGARGIAHINADITVAIARLPVTNELGIAALERIECDGIAIGTAVLFDRQGTLGTSVVSALANADKRIDLSAR